MRRTGVLLPVGATACLVVAQLQGTGRGGRRLGYLSELGARGSPGAAWFAAAVALAAAGTLVAAWQARAEPLRCRPLAVAGVAALVGAALRCEPGCPIPLVDAGASAVDTGHFLAFGAAFACWPAAMLAPPPERWSRAAGLAVCAHLAVLGPLLLVDPHGPAGGVLQRTMVAVALLWLAGRSLGGGSR